jgi:hypothetical protein
MPGFFSFFLVTSRSISLPRSAWEYILRISSGKDFKACVITQSMGTSKE